MLNSIKHIAIYHTLVIKYIFSDKRRLYDFDETWAIRWSVAQIYGEYPIKTHTTVYFKSNGTLNRFLSWIETCFCYSLIWVSHSSNLKKPFQITNFVWKSLKRLLCCFLTILMYTFCCLIGCLPCIHYYLCRKNSLTRRHKCSKSFVK
jgi:hypothetical protein